MKSRKEEEEEAGERRWRGAEKMGKKDEERGRGGKTKVKRRKEEEAGERR